MRRNIAAMALTALVIGATVASVVPAGAEPPPPGVGIRPPSTDAADPGSGTELAQPPIALPEGSGGGLDPTFSGDGIAQTNVTPGADYASGVAVQADGAIVTAGGAGGNGGRFGLVRYTSAGVLDTTFGGDGSVQTNFSTAADLADDLVIAPDGDLYVVGSANYDRGNGNMAVARYNPDGSLDTAFSGDGKATVDFGGPVDEGFAIGLQDNGKIVIAGVGGQATNLAVARLRPNGSLDGSFSGDGKALTNITGDFEIASDLVVAPNGDILVTGEAVTFNFATNPPSATEKMIVVQYNSNGTLDTSFSSDGIFVDSGAARTLLGTSLALQDDGKVVVVGGRTSGSSIVRLTSSGALDPTFSGDGRNVVNFSGPDIAWGVGIQEDGAIVVGGIAGNGDQNFALARFTSAGGLDGSFGTGGSLTTDPTTGDDGITDLVIQDDGAIVAAGYAAGASKVVVARYLPS